VPTEAELHEVRFEFDPAPALETLMLHFCGEIRLNHWYRRAAEWHSEPVIKAIYETLARDEARHGGAYLRYMKRAMNKFGDEARSAFAKVGGLPHATQMGGWPGPYGLGRMLWGVGTDENTVTASLRAVLSAHERHTLTTAH
jgi:rubrerythrin